MLLNINNVSLISSGSSTNIIRSQMNIYPFTHIDFKFYGKTSKIDMTWMMSKSNIWNGHKLVGYIWERATIYA